VVNRKRHTIQSNGTRIINILRKKSILVFGSVLLIGMSLWMLGVYSMNRTTRLLLSELPSGDWTFLVRDEEGRPIPEARMEILRRGSQIPAPEFLKNPETSLIGDDSGRIVCDCSGFVWSLEASCRLFWVIPITGEGDHPGFDLLVSASGYQTKRLAVGSQVPTPPEEVIIVLKHTNEPNP
jgi:hypothetical protein